MISNMPCVTFDQMHYAFKHKLKINSLYSIICHLAVLSGLEPLYFDCCLNACIAYTGNYADLNQCPLCDQTRFRGADRKPHHQFCYIPFIPRLQNLFTNPKTIKEILYQFNYQVLFPTFLMENIIQELRQTRVTVNRKKLPHKYFSGKNDIAFSGMLGWLLALQAKMWRTLCDAYYDSNIQLSTRNPDTHCLGAMPQCYTQGTKMP